MIKADTKLDRTDTVRPPALFVGKPEAEKRFWEFFAVTIRNKGTREAYLNAAWRFSDWCTHRGLDLDAVTPMAVAAYVERLQMVYAAPTINLHLAALRSLFDWLAAGQVVPFNPAAPVRGVKYAPKVGKAPVLTAEEARALLHSIETDTLVGLRDRALIGVMVYSFARVSAATGMSVADYYAQGKRSFFKLHEKNGKYLVVPAHHQAQAFVDAYIEGAGLSEDPKGPLFRSSGKGRNGQVLQRKAMTRQTALQMVKRRAVRAGLPDVCCHSFRATGITEYLKGGGDRETAARIAGHESTRTTRLYDRTDQEVTLDEIERIHI